MRLDNLSEGELSVQPASAVALVKPYKIPPRRGVVDLPLGNTERLFFTSSESAGLLATLQDRSLEDVVGYPDPSELESLIATEYGVSPEQVIVTAGGDEALERACKSVLMPGTEVVVPHPTFDMIPIYAGLCGATVTTVPWTSGPYPVDAVLACINPNTRALVMISPNNPTGTAVTGDEATRLAKAAPQVLVIADLAYAEFADEDLLPALLAHPNVVMTRTFSKAWGLAGLRVGFAIGDSRVISWMRGASGPYSVSKLSLAMAAARLRENDDSIGVYIDRVKKERNALCTLIEKLGGAVTPSQANFVLARFENSTWVRDALEGLGIGVRVFPEKPGLENAIRITCPGHAEKFSRLTSALNAVLAPAGIIFDLDGVLADVSASYRLAIIETAAAFGVQITRDDIAREKAVGNANNDWVLTQRICGQKGVDISFSDIKEKFEELYQGSAEKPGLRASEKLLVSKAWLDDLGSRFPLGIVTGRPRTDALFFLETHGILSCFENLVCMEDSELKPSPAPVNLCLRNMGIETAWMIGDTPDDIRAARKAGVVPVGVLAPGDECHVARESLMNAGAAIVLAVTNVFKELLDEHAKC